ncbi:hypothetical protein ACTHSK_05290 [Neisseria sp. P0012.S006]|nr:hypothetical protein [Neisseria subflava]
MENACVRTAHTLHAGYGLLPEYAQRQPENGKEHISGVCKWFFRLPLTNG